MKILFMNRYESSSWLRNDYAGQGSKWHAINGKNWRMAA